MRISYVELYNNTFRNLLDFASKEVSSSREGLDKSRQTDVEGSFIDGALEGRGAISVPSNFVRSDKIEVRESQSAGVFLSGPNLRIPVTSAREAFNLISRGNRFRATGSTNCNEDSSRFV